MNVFKFFRAEARRAKTGIPKGFQYTIGLTNLKQLSRIEKIYAKHGLRLTLAENINGLYIYDVSAK